MLFEIRLDLSLLALCLCILMAAGYIGKAIRARLGAGHEDLDETTCADCEEATGGVCRAHAEPECTCYEVTGGHMPGCPFNRGATNAAPEPRE